MPYTIEVLPGEPILVEVWQKDFEMGSHAAKFLTDITKVLDEAQEPMTNIVDMRLASVGLDDVILGANLATRLTAFTKHPKLRRSIFVTTSKMIALAARGLNSPVFGNRQVYVCDTVEEAIAKARQ